MFWWLNHWCASIRSWVQFLMDVCINVSCTNVIYKYVHQGDWCENLFIDKIGKKENLIFFSRHVILSQHAVTKMQSLL